MGKISRQRSTVFWGVLLGALLVFYAICDGRTRGLLANTGQLAAGAIVIAVPCGTVLAILLFKTDLPGRRLGLGLTTALLFLPLYLHAAAWEAGFGLQGWLRMASESLAPVEPPFWFAAIWIHGVAAIPWVVLIVGAALLRVDPLSEEHAQLEASAWSALWRITLPQIRPALLVAVVWITAVASTEIAATDLFQVRTFAEEIYTQAALGAAPAALAWPSGGEETSAPVPFWRGTVWLIGILGVMLFACRHYVHEAIDAGDRPVWQYRWKRHRWLGVLLLVAFLSGLVVTPVANLVYKAGVVVTQLEDGRSRQWSAGKALERIVAAPREHAREIGWSTQTGLLAASAALVIALPLAMLGRRGRATALLMLLTAVLLAVPGPVWGLATIRSLNWPTTSWLSPLTFLYDRTLAAPCLVQTLRALPLCTLVIWSALIHLPAATLENAMLEGAGHWRRMVWIALPQIWPNLLAAWLIAAMIALGELTATVLVQPPGVTTLPTRLFSLLHYGVEDRVAAISLFMILSLAGITAVAARLVGLPGETYSRPSQIR